MIDNVIKNVVQYMDFGCCFDLKEFLSQAIEFMGKHNGDITEDHSAFRSGTKVIVDEETGDLIEEIPIFNDIEYQRTKTVIETLSLDKNVRYGLFLFYIFHRWDIRDYRDTKKLFKDLGPLREKVSTFIKNTGKWDSIEMSFDAQKACNSQTDLEELEDFRLSIGTPKETFYQSEEYIKLANKTVPITLCKVTMRNGRDVVEMPHNLRVYISNLINNYKDWKFHFTNDLSIIDDLRYYTTYANDPITIKWTPQFCGYDSVESLVNDAFKRLFDYRENSRFGDKRQTATNELSKTFIGLNTYIIDNAKYIKAPYPYYAIMQLFGLESDAELNKLGNNRLRIKR